MALNRTTLIGHLGHDPELTVSRNGVPMTTLRVAVQRTSRQEDGTYAKEPDWFSLVVFDRLAERCAQFLRKGSQIYAEGRLHNRHWQDSQGQARVTTEIIAENIEFLGKGKREARSETEPAPDGGIEETDEPDPAE